MNPQPTQACDPIVPIQSAIAELITRCIAATAIVTTAIVISTIGISTIGISTTALADTPPPERGELRIVAQHPHNASLFTQGLALADGLLYQSSGLRGRSSVVVGPADSAEVRRHYKLPRHYFAEGLALVNNDVMVLTWQAETLLVLDRNTLGLKRRLHYRGEGWGLAYDGQHLLRSDGSDRISWHDPGTMEELRQLAVHDHWGPVRRINELEWVHGAILANIWRSGRLIAIEPTTGRVSAEWDLAPLLPAQRNFGTDGVANGIAFDTGSGHFWLTGKGWPIIYEVELSADWLDKRQGHR